MELFSYCSKNAEDVLREFGVTPAVGLRRVQAESRLREYGANEISGKKTEWFHVLLRQFTSPFVYLLFGAALVAFFFGETFDAFFIFLFLAINSCLGFYQEYKSEEILKYLRHFIVSRARIVREGKEALVVAREVVPGDIIIFKEGDIISCDSRVLECSNFFVDESILTGESLSVQKENTTLSSGVQALYQAKNIVFTGTRVVSGRAICIVLSTGRRSILGNITKLAGEAKRESSFEKHIAQFSMFILRTVLITIALVFLANIAVKGKNIRITELVIFSLALAVSVIPEALPTVTTFSLARGARRLAKNRVVIKRLSAIEDLGGIDILCTDKTGTLTENALTVESLHSPDPEKLIAFSSFCFSSLDMEKKEPNNAFDLALWNALDAEKRRAVLSVRRLLEIPFDPEKRRNAVLIQRDEKNILISRGAPETIMKYSLLTDEERHHWNRILVEEGKRGRRIVAVSVKYNIEGKNAFFSEHDMVFLGMITFIDPVKKGVRESIEKAERLGVAIKILTGDSPEVAGAVAKEIGLIEDIRSVILGDAFERMSLKKKIDAIEKYAVFARTTPEQKYRIIQILREKHQVGFLGEGINDAPALKISDVGLVVHDASDIARESADIILLHKGLNVIIDGIKEGREVFANTIKYIKATLSSNFGNFYAVAIASLLIDFLPMLPIQILLVNLLSDFPMVAIATDHVDEEDIKKPQRYNIREIALLALVLGLVSTAFDFIFFAIFSRISPGVLQTNWFISSIITELVFLFSIRTRRFFMNAKRSSATLLALSFVAFGATFILPFTAFGRETFHFLPPEPWHILVILFVVGCYFAVTEAAKLLYYGFFRHERKLP